MNSALQRTINTAEKADGPIGTAEDFGCPPSGVTSIRRSGLGVLEAVRTTRPSFCLLAMRQVPRAP